MKLSKPVLFTLIGAIVVILYLFLFAGPKKTPITSVTSKVDAQKVTEQEAVKQKERTQEDVKKISHVDAHWSKDPFLLPKITDTVEEMPEAPLKLSGIIEGSDGRYAIVGTSIVKKGDFIGDERVLEIGKDSIIITRKGKKKIISVTDIPKGGESKGTSSEEKR